jgi:hypothetical protein
MSCNGKNFDDCSAAERSESALRELRVLCEIQRVPGEVFVRIEACTLQYGRACADIAIADCEKKQQGKL